MTLSLRRVPFRLRLTLSFAVVMIVLFGGLALLLQTRFSASLDQAINRSLHTHFFDLETLLAGKKNLPQLPEYGNEFAQVVNPNTGAVVDRVSPGPTVSVLNRAQLRSAAQGPPNLIPRRDNARVLAGPVDTEPAAVLVVGSPLSQRDASLNTLTELLFIGGPGLLILTCLAGYMLAARALAPVERMSAQAARISGAREDERLPVPEANDELRQLGETLNAMLSRVEEALERERAFVADAGHELRTPLSILKLELELALQSDTSREELEQRLHSVAEEVDRLAKLATDLLVIARAEQGRLPLDKQRIEVDDVLGAVAARFATPAGGTGRTVSADGADGLQLEADPVRLEQALTNMVSNALRYGAGTVGLSAVRHNGTVELHVVDEGSGFDPDFLPRAFERFSRADPARSRGGAGLGLSIVQIVAEAHGGQAHAANRDAGGADVWLSLPGS